jgi:hypothetical protein
MPKLDWFGRRGDCYGVLIFSAAALVVWGIPNTGPPQPPRSAYHCTSALVLSMTRPVRI